MLTNIENKLNEASKDQLPDVRKMIEKPERFKEGKKLSKEEKQEILKGLKDSYKVMNRPRIQVQILGNEKYEWDGDSADYMQTSDITGRKVRWFIVMPDGKIAHPTELYPEIPLSEIEREARNIEQQEQLSEKRYKKML